jgi:hypothetical protein
VAATGQTTQLEAARVNLWQIMIARTAPANRLHSFPSTHKLALFALFAPDLLFLNYRQKSAEQRLKFLFAELNEKMFSFFRALCAKEKSVDANLS